MSALLIPTTHKDVISLTIFYFEGTKPTMLQLCGILQTLNVNWMVGISDYLCNSQCGYEYVYEDCFVSISINKFARCTSLDRLGPAPWTLLST